MSTEDLQRFQETDSEEKFSLQNSKMLRVALRDESIHARLGAMVAYQGGIRFESKSGGLGRMFKKAVSGEELELMSATGTGDLFIAHDARDLILLDLSGERMTVNAANIAAFDTGIEWDIRRVEGAGRLAGGLFNVVLEGSGKVALSAHGSPVLLQTGGTPTFADPQAAIAWGGDVTTSIKTDVSLKTFIGRGSGESLQLAFSGDGWVLVQASEGPTVPPHSHSGGGS